eukprot:738130-Rhodomonas_salina.1
MARGSGSEISRCAFHGLAQAGCRIPRTETASQPTALRTCYAKSGTEIGNTGGRQWRGAPEVPCVCRARARRGLVPAYAPYAMSSTDIAYGAGVLTVVAYRSVLIERMKLQYQPARALRESCTDVAYSPTRASMTWYWTSLCVRVTRTSRLTLDSP